MQAHICVFKDKNTNTKLVPYSAGQLGQRSLTISENVVRDVELREILDDASAWTHLAEQYRIIFRDMHFLYVLLSPLSSHTAVTSVPTVRTLVDTSTEREHLFHICRVISHPTIPKKSLFLGKLWYRPS